MSNSVKNGQLVPAPALEQSSPDVPFKIELPGGQVVDFSLSESRLNTLKEMARTSGKTLDDVFADALETGLDLIHGMHVQVDLPMGTYQDGMARAKEMGISLDAYVVSLIGKDRQAGFPVLERSGA